MRFSSSSYLHNLFNLNSKLSTKPENHTMVLVKNYLRASARIKETKYIQTIYEYAKKEDIDITCQGLVGRMCGYDKIYHPNFHLLPL